jgi:hypothetical protein
MAVYSEVPAPLGSWIIPSLNLVAIFSVSAWLVSVGVLIRLRAGKQQSIASNLVLVTSIATYMVMQKLVIRPPGMAQETMIMAVITVMMYCYVCFLTRRLACRVAFFVFVGIMAAVMVYQGVPIKFLGRLKASVPLVVDNVSALTKRPLINSVLLNEYSPDRFRDNAAIYEVYEALMVELATAPEAKVYVLGDDPVLYIMLGQKPPYHVNLFNASPIFEQHAVTAWIEKVKPEYVVWNPSQTSFDLVPNVVRCPLIYEKVIQGFTAYKSVGRYEILRRKQPGETTNVEYWKARLGDHIDVGHLARLSSAPNMTPCDSANAVRCAAFLHVNVKESVGERLEIPLQVGPSEFTVVLSTVSGESDYVVALDRLWFWHIPRLEGRTPQLGQLRPGIEARIFLRQPDDDVLY